MRRKTLTIAARAADLGIAWFLLSYFWALLRVRPRRVLRDAIPASRVGVGVGFLTPESRLRTLISAVDRAAELHPLHPQCLERALAVRILLSLKGEQSCVVIGVCREHESEGLRAHAWVELRGSSVDESCASFVQMVHLQ